MQRIGILAYGSLINDPGEELEPLICERVKDIETPFSIEFARSSKSRGGAPTLIPVEKGGSPVRGEILVLDASVDEQQAEDLIWRREIRTEDKTRRYSRPSTPGPNHVLVERVRGLAGVEIVLYTKIGSNIKNHTPTHLADLAICSARRKAGEKKRDGINYLLDVKQQGILTPQMPEYEAAIRNKTDAHNLLEAYEKIREGYV